MFKLFEAGQVLPDFIECFYVLAMTGPAAEYCPLHVTLVPLPPPLPLVCNPLGSAHYLFGHTDSEAAL